MGVRGLLSFIKSNHIAGSMQTLSRGSHLLIDGNGYIFALLNFLKDSTVEFPYTHYAFILRREISYLRDDLGLILEIYFDGSERRFKQETDNSRYEARLDMWIQLHDIFALNLPWRRRDLPMPAFLYEFAMSTILELKVPVVRCKGEADQDISIACLKHRARGEQSYCFAEDSDFWFMKDIAYIRFEDMYSSKKQSNNSAGVPVWTRKELAACLQFPSEELFLEWGIALGNDFTSSLDSSLYSNVPSKLFDAGNMDRFHVLREFMLEQGGDFRLETSDARLETAMDYSRLFYGLEDVSSFPIDQRHDGVDSEVDDEDDNGVGDNMNAVLSTRKNHRSKSIMSLSSKQDIEILHHVRSIFQDLVGNRQLTSRDVGTIVIDFWSVALFTKGNQGEPVVGGDTDIVLSDCLNPQYMEAFRDMINELSESDNNNGHDVEAMLERSGKKVNTSVADWNHFLAGHAYQQSCLSVMRCIRLCTQEGKSTNLSSRQRGSNLLKLIKWEKLYDPLVFASCLQRVQAEDLKQSKSKNERVSAYAVPFPRPVSASSSSTAMPQSVDLPIDKYRDQILERIARDRVTIIHGETGCGKSSRLPQMLLEHAEAMGVPCTMMVSQPRRIAASSLYKRVRQTLGDKVGLRMGHGIKEEKDCTKIFFVTTGYLVRLLAHHPSAFDHHSHLIIDEVHERSVDGDVLCLLAKRLLSRNKTIRIVLMSATIHVELYGKYFRDEFGGAGNGSMECLSVGVRRFPIHVQFLDQLGSVCKGRPEIALQVNRMLATKSCPESSPDYIKLQYRLASMLTGTACRGSAVLIFVSGMVDIIALAEVFEQVPHYRVVGIHSDIPHEEQEAAFEPTLPDEVKVIIATNSAESSVTLPDVDIVICLGTHKIIQYDTLKHQEVLCLRMISKASATQRAGRTGRVRPGTVYRLYSEEVFNALGDHDMPEVLRVPLQETILNLRLMLEKTCDFEGVVPLLEELLDPPDMQNVQSSFEYLHESELIDKPGDDGILTNTGRFVGALPVSIEQGRFIYYSVLTGVEDCGVIIAAALSLPRSPFRIASPLIHKDPNVFNDLVQKTFLTAVKFDHGAYSEPLMLLELLLAYRQLKTSGEQDKFCRNCGLWQNRMRHFDTISKNLETSVKSVLKRVVGKGWKAFDEKTADEVEKDRQTKLNITVGERNNLFRLFFLWTQTKNNILHFSNVNQMKVERALSASLQINSPFLSPKQVDSLFPQHLVPHVLSTEESSIHSVSIDASAWLQLKSAGLKVSGGRGGGRGHEAAELSVLVLESIIIDVVSMASIVDDGPPVLWVKARKRGSYGYAIAVHKVNCAMHDTILDAAVSLAEASNAQHANVLELDGDSTGGYTIFMACFECLSMKRISKFDHQLKNESRSFHIQFIDSQNVKAFSKNCNMPLPMLESIFNLDGDVEIDIRTVFAKPTTQVVNFSVSPLEAQQENYSKSTCRALFNDVALGIRLVRAYRSGNNKGTYSVRQDSDSEDSQKLPVSAKNEAVVGSKEWARANGKDNTSVRGAAVSNSTTSVVDNTGTSIETCVVNSVGVDGGGWHTLLDGKHASLPRYSVPAACIYTGTESLFATTSSILNTPQMVRCEGVTIFPPGDEWMFLAFTCLGDDAGAKVLSYLCIDEYADSYDVDSMDIVRELFSQQQKEQLQFNRDITLILLEMFAKWSALEGDVFAK